MSKHTPGPWQYAFEGGTVAFIVEADGTAVAKISTTENSTAHNRLPANAQLIAAAPDLLETLQAIESAANYAKDNPRKQTDKLFDILELSRAAIAKATGKDKL